MSQIEYEEIACVQIDRAIQLYNESDYICAITLAKAGEEFLGKHLSDTAAHKTLLKNISAQDAGLNKHLNRIANFLKHGNDLELCEQDIPIRLEAIQYICRAILNFFLFTNRITPLMNNFGYIHTPNKIDELIDAEQNLCEVSAIPVPSVVKTNIEKKHA